MDALEIFENEQRTNFHRDLEFHQATSTFFFH